MTESDDLGSQALPKLEWSDQHVRASLEVLFRFAELQCMQSIDWYLREKKSKSRWSRLLRAAAILLGAAGALVPLVHAAWPEGIAVEWGYVFLALAAAAIGWDRFFGMSSAWMRYLAASFALQRVLQEFQDDWAYLQSAIGDAPPSPEQTKRALSRLKRFRSNVQAIVEEETREWIAEFESNLARLENNLDTRRQSVTAGLRARYLHRRQGVDGSPALSWGALPETAAAAWSEGTSGVDSSAGAPSTALQGDAPHDHH